MPFDGMNSRGLVIGMAAVPFSDLPSDPELVTVDSLAIMRRILDQASDVESAVDILSNIKPSWGGGPALHYMISDSSGRSLKLLGPGISPLTFCSDPLSYPKQANVGAMINYIKL
jgi:penicillin V acylase-like amidase (Ntn superfamily)